MRIHCRRGKDSRLPPRGQVPTVVASRSMPAGLFRSLVLDHVRRSVGAAHRVAPHELTEQLTRQKPSANRGAIAPNLPKRRHERLTACDIQPMAHSHYHRRCRDALPSWPAHLFGCVVVLAVLWSFIISYYCFGYGTVDSSCLKLTFQAMK